MVEPVWLGNAQSVRGSRTRIIRIAGPSRQRRQPDVRWEVVTYEDLLSVFGRDAKWARRVANLICGSAAEDAVATAQLLMFRRAPFL